MKLVIATSNPGKVAEISALLKNSRIELLSLADYPDMHEIAEDGPTFMENALKKARETSAYTGHTALADDSGLEVDALDGKPGVMSARLAPTSEDRINKLLELMKDVTEELCAARFVCVLALVCPDGFEWTTTGCCYGIITKKPYGNSGFGYDPIFYYEPFGKTFAEISLETKNQISHRGIALEAFKNAIINDGILRKYVQK